MATTAVIYKSKYGSTEKYAKWIAEDINGDLFKVSDIKINQLKNYENIVYCGGLYAGGILGFSFIKKNFHKISDKKLIVVAVGATLKKDDAVDEVKNRNLTPKMKDKVCVFLVRGCLNYKKMNILDKFLMYMLVKSLKAKDFDTLDNDSKGIIATYGKVVDFTNRDTIQPIVNAVKS